MIRSDHLIWWQSTHFSMRYHGMILLSLQHERKHVSVSTVAYVESDSIRWFDLIPWFDGNRFTSSWDIILSIYFHFSKSASIWELAAGAFVESDSIRLFDLIMWFDGNHFISPWDISVCIYFCISISASIWELRAVTFVAPDSIWLFDLIAWFDGNQLISPWDISEFKYFRYS